MTTFSQWTRWQIGRLGGVEQYREWNRDRQKAHRDKVRGAAERSRLYRAQNPEKSKAHKAVERAVARGELARPALCSCGRPDPQAHHDDYARPLEVLWLCAVCHSARHQWLNGKAA